MKMPPQGWTLLALLLLSPAVSAQNSGPDVPLEQDESVTPPIYSPNAPWTKAGIDYQRFRPDYRNPEHTGKPGLRPRWKVLDDTLYIDGEVIAEIADELTLDAEGRITAVVLNSYGGLVTAGQDLAENIRRRGLTTIVPARGQCSSICTLIFQAGLRRLAARDAQFMYHGARAGSMVMQTIYRDVLERDGPQAAERLFYETWASDTARRTEEMFSAIESYGASRALREDYFRLPDEPNFFERGNPLRKPDWTLSAEQAARYGVVTELF